MTMRKKDYEAIARAISDIQTKTGMTPGSHARFVLRLLTDDIADYCATQDPTFKRDRFLADCGVQS